MQRQTSVMVDRGSKEWDFTARTKILYKMSLSSPWYIRYIVWTLNENKVNKNAACTVCSESFQGTSAPLW